MGWVTYNRNVFPQSFGGWKSKIKVPVCSRPGENPLLVLQTAAFLLCSHMAERDRPTDWERETERGEREQALWCPSCKGTNPMVGVPTLMTSSNSNYLLKTPPPNIITPGLGLNI